MSNPPSPPPGMTAGLPPGPPLGPPAAAGAPPAGGVPPAGATPPPQQPPLGMRMGGRQGMPPGMMSARPYLGRAVRLLGHHKALTGVTMLLSLLVTLFPFIVSISFSSIFQILGPLAGPKPPGMTNVPGSIW